MLMLSMFLIRVGKAQNVHSVPVSIIDSLFIEDDISVEEAKIELLNIVRQRAIEKVTGIQIKSFRSLTESESNNSYFNSYKKLISVNIDGKITTEHTIKYSKQSDYLVINYSAEVSKDFSKPDPYFKVSIKTDKRIYQVGNNLVLKVEATKPSYIHIITIDEKNLISQLFPNYYMDENFISANTERRIPNKKEEQVLSFTLGEYIDKNSYTELLICIATKKPISFKELTSNIEYTDNWLILNNWLMSIPRNEWTEAYASYTVFR